jgi:hypothetical protein
MWLHLLIKEDLCDCRTVSGKFLCGLLVYLYLSFGDLFIFSVRVRPFYSYFGVKKHDRGTYSSFYTSKEMS